MPRIMLRDTWNPAVSGVGEQRIYSALYNRNSTRFCNKKKSIICPDASNIYITLRTQYFGLKTLNNELELMLGTPNSFFPYTSVLRIRGSRSLAVVYTEYHRLDFPDYFPGYYKTLIDIITLNT